jgi:hypothetical protein
MVELNVIALESAVIFLLTGYLIVLVQGKKKAILSNNGKKVLRKDISTLKIGVYCSLASLILYLLAETADIIGNVFSDQVDVVLYELVHEYFETVHLFILIIGLILFASVIIKVDDKNG